MRIYLSPVVVTVNKKAPSRSWHRHAAEGTFPHVRSSQRMRTSSTTMVLLMPSRPISFLPLLMLHIVAQ
jgi:hypothetical protein